MVFWQAEKTVSGKDWTCLKGKKVILSVCFGENIGRRMERMIEEMKLHGCEVEGFILTDVKDSFLKKYYGTKKL